MTNEKYVAFDVHLATITFCILDVLGKILWEGTFANAASTIRDFLGGLHGRIHLTFEQGTLAAWLYDLVKPLVATVIVCNPRYNRVVLCGNKSDRIDARKLAEQLRIGALRPVYQTQQSLRPLKQLVLGYEALVGDSVRTMVRIRALMQGRGVSCKGEALYNPAKHDFWLSRITDPGLRFRIQNHFHQLDSLMPLREKTKKQLQLESAKNPQTNSLFRADPLRSNRRYCRNRFRTKRQYWPYCGLAVVNRTTSDYTIIGGMIRKKNRKNTTRGLNRDYSRILKRVYKSAALQATTHKLFAPLYKSLLQNNLKPEMARLTLARKIASISLTLWKKEQKFNANICFTNTVEYKEKDKTKKKLSLNKKTAQ